MKVRDLSPGYTDKLKNQILALGADLAGIADVEPLKALRVDPPDLLEPFSRAVSIALQLPVDSPDCAHQKHFPPYGLPLEARWRT